MWVFGHSTELIIDIPKERRQFEARAVGAEGSTSPNVSFANKIGVSHPSMFTAPWNGTDGLIIGDSSESQRPPQVSRNLKRGSDGAVRTPATI